MSWVYDPHSGGLKIPPNKYNAICEEVAAFSRTRPWRPKIQLKLRFKSQFCYVDTLEIAEGKVFPLCRLRYFHDKGWSLALFTYSNERYEACYFMTGKWEGTLTEALETCEDFIV